MKITSPIQIFENSTKCNENCFDILKYTKLYTNPTDEGSKLAIILIREYKSSEDFFIKAFSKKTRYAFRQIEQQGFLCRQINVNELNNRLKDLYSINTSAKERQGGKMKETYFQFPLKRVEPSCQNHFVKTYGAFNHQGVWVGYIDMVFGGEWTNTRHLLGHQFYLDSCKRGSFMINLWFCMVKDIIENHTHVNYIQYHLMGVGNPGLDEWKRKVGLREAFIV